MGKSSAGKVRERSRPGENRSEGTEKSGGIKKKKRAVVTRPNSIASDRELRTRIRRLAGERSHVGRPILSG